MSLVDVLPRPWGRRPTRLGVSLVGLALVVGLVLWVVPVLQVERARERLALTDQLAPADRLTLENQLFESENAARLTLAMMLASASVLVGAAVIWRRYELSREPKAYARFAEAVEQLGAERGDGSPRTEVRLSGIYALERLAVDSEREYWPVMEVLTAYVRDNAAWARTGTDPQRALRPTADVQAVLAVLGRRQPPNIGTTKTRLLDLGETDSHEKNLLDLRETDLRGANLSASRFAGVTLHAAHLERVEATRARWARSNLREASLAGASFTEADLQGASLSKANLEGARLNGANLAGADLTGANLRGADLWQTNLKGCNLKDTDLRGADLSQCVLEEAILWRADLQAAVLTNAQVRETHLERANLSGVTGLTWEQAREAYTDDNTVLPEYLAPARPSAAPPATPAARRTSPKAAPAPAAETNDNVVQLKAPAGRTRTKKAEAAEASPKKAALPKHRKPGLVKPA